MGGCAAKSVDFELCDIGMRNLSEELVQHWTGDSSQEIIIDCLGFRYYESSPIKIEILNKGKKFEERQISYPEKRSIRPGYDQ